MHVRLEMAVRTLHAFLQMDILEMHGTLKVTVRNDIVFLVQPVALLILLEDGPEDPAVPVIVGELGMFQLWV